jgi:hydroxymethylpyrimidine pyrophosphatase-like HAD family hydrolase
VRYRALASDYDGTLATDGKVEPETVEALRRLARSGRKLILVTGRQLPDLLDVFPEAASFDRIVAENGAVLYDPGRSKTRALAEPPPEHFVDELQREGVTPLWQGMVVVATQEPHGTAVQQVIKKLGLELQVILNKGSVMVLPSAVDKVTGLRAALSDLGLAPDRVMGIGDAENDQAFLAMCGRGVAVANALDAVKAHADQVTRGDAGAGVREVIDWLIAEDP